jgi:lipoprotein NlpI
MKRAVRVFLSLMTGLLLALAAASCSNKEADYSDGGLAKQEKGDLDGAIADYTKAIEMKTGDSAPYMNRASAKILKGDYDGAIADSAKAIELDPREEGAYNNRGVARKDKGDLEGAIADSTIAIALQADDPKPYLNRGLAKQFKGDLAGAIADFTKVTQLQPQPDDTGAFVSLGCVYYESHDFANALNHFRIALLLDPTNDFEHDYDHFRVWLSQARMGEAEAATTELQEYLAGRANGGMEDWVLKTGRFLTGQLAEAEFFAAAKNADPKKEAGQLCEAYFYAGTKRLLAGDKAAAADYFQKAIATNMKDYTEYTGALAELKFLKGETK